MSSFKENVLGGDQSRYDAVIKRIGFDGVGAVLDAGCGYGQWSRALSRCGNRVTGIDIDQEKLDEAVDLLDVVRGVMYYTADMETFDMGPDGGYDAIFSYSAIYWAGSHWPKVLANWYNLLKPGGEVYFTTNAWGYFLTHPTWAAKALWNGARPMNPEMTADVMEIDIGFEPVIWKKDPFYEPTVSIGPMEPYNVFAMLGRKPE